MDIIPEISNEQKADALDFIFEEYFKIGFGALNKSDIDLIFFAALKKYGKIDNDSDYYLSKKLCITQQRVRNLKIKIGLKYISFSKSEIKDLFLNQINSAQIEENKIIIPINDPNLFLELQNILEESNGYLDIHLNPKISK